ncbi:MAG: hypothetical protein ACK5KT_05985 [Dysgonomonas sp.]
MWTITDKQIAAIAGSMKKEAEKIAAKHTSSNKSGSVQNDKIRDTKSGNSNNYLSSSNTNNSENAMSSSTTQLAPPPKYPTEDITTVQDNTRVVLPCLINEVLYVQHLKVPQVQKIKIKTPLDDGFGGKGMIYNKTYELEVESFVANKPPQNEKDIRWELGYTDDSGTIVVVALKNKGKKIKFKADDFELLGKDTTFYAYIGEEKENGAKEPIRIHNRFRWLNKTECEKEAKARKLTAELINQGGTNTCGIAAPCYFFARDTPDIYYDTVMSIFQKGEAIIPSTKYKIKVDSDEHLTEYTESDLSTLSIDKADFVLLATLRDQLNDFLDYDPKNDGKKTIPYSNRTMDDIVANNFESDVRTIMDKLSNYKKIIRNVATVPIVSASIFEWTDAEGLVKDLNEKLNDGYSLALCVNMDYIRYNKDDGNTAANHWISLVSVNYSSSSKKITLKVYTWGKTITYIVDALPFENGYFGYIAGKL